jgi:hypothetical protein
MRNACVDFEFRLIVFGNTEFNWPRLDKTIRETQVTSIITNLALGVDGCTTLQ